MEWMLLQGESLSMFVLLMDAAAGRVLVKDCFGMFYRLFVEAGTDPLGRCGCTFVYLW
jgi:hypothetical protein